MGTAAPAIPSGIIGFHLVEGARGCLSPKHENPPLEHRRRDAAAGRGHRRALLPAIGCGIVRLVCRQIARIVAINAAAHGVETSVHGGGRQVVARRRDIGERRPPVGGRIVDLVRGVLRPRPPMPPTAWILPPSTVAASAPRGVGRAVRRCQRSLAGRTRARRRSASSPRRSRR
jgi:hypothetical protein